MHPVSGMPPVSGELAEVREVSAGLRAANERLRELLAERDARIGQMEAQIADLQAQVADLAARVKQSSLLREISRSSRAICSACSAS